MLVYDSKLGISYFTFSSLDVKPRRKNGNETVVNEKSHFVELQNGFFTNRKGRERWDFLYLDHIISVGLLLVF